MHSNKDLKGDDTLLEEEAARKERMAKSSQNGLMTTEQINSCSFTYALQ